MAHVKASTAAASAHNDQDHSRLLPRGMGDNSTSSYRRHLDERDVLLEAAFFHSGCYDRNMSTGLVSRGLIATGIGVDEESDHYYGSFGGHQESC